jgi:hypothetical protein
MTASLTWPHSPSPYETAKQPKKYRTPDWLKMKNSDAWSEFFTPHPPTRTRIVCAHSARVWRQELSGIIAQRLKLEQKIDHMASKLCILGFEPFKSSLIAELCGFRIRHCQGDMWIRTAPNTVTCKLQAQHILSPAWSSYLVHESASLVGWYRPPLARRKILEYTADKLAGVYGGSRPQRLKFFERMERATPENNVRRSAGGAATTREDHRKRRSGPAIQHRRSDQVPGLAWMTQ